MTNRQALILQELARPGFKMVMEVLQAEADKLQKEYDTINFVTEPYRAMHIQVTRDVITNGIPRILEQIANEGGEEPRWSFWTWLTRRKG